MDPRYRDIYATIYVSRTAGPPFGRFLGYGPEGPRWRRAGPPVGDAVRDAIEQAAERHGRIREDAKALLAVNFQDLVLLPLDQAGRVPLREVLRDVNEDISMLVGNAAEIGEPDEQGISGHAVIDALSRTWDRLRISRFRLWERSSGE